MKIPISKPFLGKEEATAAHDTILTGWVTQGPRVEEFENNFASYVGAKFAVAVSSCTTALHLALICADIKEGDEVICPSMSYIATANSIRYVNATPVFAEVGEDFNLDLNDVRKKITNRTKAIILVHQIGNPADIDAFKKLCDDHQIQLIEDAACAIGSEYKERKIGAHSDLVCFSFHPRKVITTGDGGMITTNNESYYKQLKLLRQHGMSVNDRERHGSQKVIIEEYPVLGYNYRMTDIQASIGIEQLKRLDGIIRDRRKIAELYNDSFSELKDISVYHEKEGLCTNYQSYAISINNKRFKRNDIMQQLLDKGISTRRGIMLIHQEKAYDEFPAELPQSEHLSNKSILIPLYVPMSEQEVQYVIKAIVDVFS